MGEFQPKADLWVTPFSTCGTSDSERNKCQRGVLKPLFTVAEGDPFVLSDNNSFDKKLSLGNSLLSLNRFFRTTRGVS